MWQQVKSRWKGAPLALPLVAVIASMALIFGLFLGVSVPGIRTLSAATMAAPDGTMSPTAVTLPSFASLAKTLSPAVVNIRVTQIQKTEGKVPTPFNGPSGEDSSPFGEYFHRFFQGTPQAPRNYRTEGAGSGFILSPDGIIVTNRHVIEGAKDITVTLANKEEYSAKVIGQDEKTDLAVLRIKPKGKLPAVSMGNSDQLQVGDWVVAIGNPFGLSNTWTAGIVSAKERVIGAGPYDDFIQTDASINPGNSGGPLFNLEGQVVGINTAIIAGGKGIGFAIPSNLAKNVLDQLVNKGEISRGWLGVTIQSISPELQKSLGLKDSKGALVADLVPNGPAEKAGVQRGDVITTYDGKEVSSSNALPALVAGTPVGNTVGLKVLRNNEPKDLTVKVGKLPSEKTAEVSPSKKKSEPGKWGLQMENLTPDLARQFGISGSRGVVVTGVVPDSPADAAGIEEGDIIREVNRHNVNSVQEAQSQVEKSKNSLLLLVQRGQGSLFAALEIK